MLWTHRSHRKNNNYAILADIGDHQGNKCHGACWQELAPMCEEGYRGRGTLGANLRPQKSQRERREREKIPKEGSIVNYVASLLWYS